MCITQWDARPVAEQISLQELCDDSDRIMRGLEKGQSFIVRRNGTPIGELHPRRHRFVSAYAAVETFRGAPRVNAAALRRDIDDVADQDLPDRV